MTDSLCRLTQGAFPRYVGRNRKVEGLQAEIMKLARQNLELQQTVLKQNETQREKESELRQMEENLHRFVEHCRDLPQVPPHLFNSVWCGAAGILTLGNEARKQERHSPNKEPSESQCEGTRPRMD